MSGIHSMISCQQMSLSLFPSSVKVFQQGLNNWLQIWRARSIDSNNSAVLQLKEVENTLQKVGGFTRHAIEYHALAESKLNILIDNIGATPRILALSAESADVAEVVHLALGLL